MELNKKRFTLSVLILLVVASGLGLLLAHLGLHPVVGTLSGLALGGLTMYVLTDWHWE